MHIQNLSLLNNDKDNIIEKLNKKLKTQQEKVTELQKDEILMLQDLSTQS